MKKRIIALLVMLTVMCWAAVAFAVTIPVTANEVTLPSGIEHTVNELPSVETRENEDGSVTIFFSSNPFLNEEYVSDEIDYTDVSIRFFDEDEGYSLQDLTKADLKKTDKGYEYTILAENAMTWDGSFFIHSYYRNSDKDAYSLHMYYFSSNEISYSLETDAIDYDKMEYGYNVWSYNSDYQMTFVRDTDYFAYYDANGDIIQYGFWPVEHYEINFDKYGRLDYVQYWDEIEYEDEDGWHYYTKDYWWNADKGWHYWDDELGEDVFVDMPDGAIDPTTITPPLALPIPETEFVLNSSGLNLPPLNPADLAEIESVEEIDGKWVVTLKSDPFANDYDHGEESAYADVGIFNELDGETYELWYLGSDAERDGNTFSFDIPEGAELLWASVDTNIHAGNVQYYVRCDSDGYTQTVCYEYGFTYYYDYDEAGSVTGVQVYNRVTGSYTYFYFDTESGDLSSYQIEADNDYYIEYTVDGTATYARYYDADEGQDYYWNPELGWYVNGYDEEDNWVSMPVDAPEGVKDPTDYEAPFVRPGETEKITRAWYPNNTVGVLGLSLRDDLGIGSKWYNIVPVDLTVPGRQTVRMVAANMYYFGSATIDVADDTVTVEYQLPNGHAYLKDECLQWFTSVDEITDAFLNNPVGEYAFGEPVSISESLNGQDVALLFICNRVTYAQPITNGGAMLTRYYRNLDQWQSWRAQLTNMLNSTMLVEAAE